MADTMQPAGALPEPELLWSHPGIPDIRIFGYTADQMRAVLADRDAWRDKAHRTDLLAEKLMAERDAALERAEFCLAFTRDAQALCATAQDEAAALLRELEELRKAGAPMANTMFNLAQRDSMPAHERESFKSMQVAWDAAPRAIPPDAREGREPLTEQSINRLITTSEVYQYHPGAILEFVRAIEAAHGIGPAGTSADGETQP